MNWNFATIGLLAASLAVSASFFAGAVFFARALSAARFTTIVMQEIKSRFGGSLCG
jgi:site-specific DNA-cytosine methylase